MSSTANEQCQYQRVYGLHFLLRCSSLSSEICCLEHTHPYCLQGPFLPPVRTPSETTGTASWHRVLCGKLNLQMGTLPGEGKLLEVGSYLLVGVW